MIKGPENSLVIANYSDSQIAHQDPNQYLISYILYLRCRMILIKIQFNPHVYLAFLNLAAG